MKPKKARLWLVPLVCYGAAILLCLLYGCIMLAIDTYYVTSGQLEQRRLTEESFFLDGIQLPENPDGSFDLLSENPDPQMLYSAGEAIPVRNLVFRAEQQSRPGGEMTLFYTTDEDEPFTENHRLWARQQPDGSWYFDLGCRKVQSLRFDPDTTGGVRWRGWEIVLNEPKPLWAYFLPDARPLFLLIFAPALVSALLCEGWHIVRGYLLRRKGKGKANGKKKRPAHR